MDLAMQGATLAIISRNLSALTETQKQIEDATKRTCLSFACDVAEPDTLENVVERVQEQHGGVDILVNNAGIFSATPVASQNLDAWRGVMEVNLTSALRASKAVLPSMIERGWGRIINISSISGKTGEPYGAAYSASKFGMIGLTQSLALEVARHGITVNSVCPGWVDTAMAHEQLTDEDWCNLNQIERSQSVEIAKLSVPQERFIEPDEVAKFVCYLCSDFARGITGQAINICGGLSLH